MRSSQDIFKSSWHVINPGCNTSANMGRVQKRLTLKIMMVSCSIGSGPRVIRFKGLIKSICDPSEGLART